MIEKFVSEESEETILREFSITLREVPTKELLYYSLLIQIGDRARIHTICAVLSSATGVPLTAVAINTRVDFFGSIVRAGFNYRLNAY